MYRSMARRTTLTIVALLCATSGVAGAAPVLTEAAAAVPAAVPAEAPATAPEGVPATAMGAAVQAAQVSAPMSAPVSALMARQASYATFTVASPETLDMVGVQPSLYRGRYYRPAIETKRRCIVRRESEGHYYSVNPTGSYRGAYQVSSALARGATWMMLPEHELLMGRDAAAATLATLRATPFDAWPRYWQDALFSTVANWDHTGSGLRHWAGGRWHC